MGHILAIRVSNFESGIMFYSRGKFGLLNNYLDKQLELLVVDCGNPLIEDCIKWDKNRTRVDFLLSAYCGFGSLVGLSNWGFDFNYKVEPKCHKLAEEAKQYFSEEDYGFFKELGRQLKVKN